MKNDSVIYVICRLGGPYGETLRPSSQRKCCMRPLAQDSILKFTVFYYMDLLSGK